MGQFTADLHIHSRYSRATSKSLTPSLLAAWAAAKGIDVLATGDFTHPAWLAEIEETLREDGSGLLVPRREPGPPGPGFPAELLAGGPRRQSDGRPGVRFMLSAEISSIYKRGGQVRKVHNLVFVPSLDAAKKLNLRLAQVGNLESDGRPILGLDSRNLLEMVLATDPRAFLVPAHIWTPWFSLFGSKSGFDTVEECFGDLAGEVFALETGLSSDPAMNRLLSALDRFRLISNSDAHSGEKLGRELNVFSGEPTYDAILRALKGEGTGSRFLGTVEFFPEEGKYHLDGHRKCGVVMDPRETLQAGGICPVCGQPLTVGVLHRVLALADRTEPVFPSGMAGHPGFVSLIPLQELIAEALGAGVGTKGVREMHGRLLARFPSELAVLQDVPPEDLARVSPVLAEAISRMRRGKVIRQPGYDGEFGRICVFSERERRELKGGGTLVGLSFDEDRNGPPEAWLPTGPGPGPGPGPSSGLPSGLAQTKPGGRNLNPAQVQAVEAGLGRHPAHGGPVLVLAGPGTGKTHTLLARIHALLDQGVSPKHILAVTFTRRAAGELRERLLLSRGGQISLPRTDTLHALAFEQWKSVRRKEPVVLSEEAARRVFAAAHPGLAPKALKGMWDGVALARERLTGAMEAAGETRTAGERYARQKSVWSLVDYTDLLEFWLGRIRSGAYDSPYLHVLVDEVQDLSRLQLEIVKGLSGKDGAGFFAIGDPNQSIYSFRGALADVRSDLARHWPQLSVVTLDRNYRSRQAILDLADAVLPTRTGLQAILAGSADLSLFHAPSDVREASWIAGRIRKLLGGTSHTLADPEATLSPGDIAVLVRFKALIPTIARGLTRLGIPCAAPETEAFWAEPRVAMILQAAGRTLGIGVTGPAVQPGQAGQFSLTGLAGMAGTSGNSELLGCPDSVLAKGPVAAAAYLQEAAPFDRLFWEGQAYKKLVKGFDEHGGWAGLISWISLQSELDLVRQRAEKVQIMTLHAAKGLEFEAVFLPGLEDGVLPFAGAELLTGKPVPWDGRPQEDEELRLLYVGLTRAKRFLALSHASRRELYGRSLQLPPSRFLARLPEDTLRQTALKAHTVRQAKQLSLL